MKPVEKRSALLTVGVLGVAAVVGLVAGFVVANQAPKETVTSEIRLVSVQAGNTGTKAHFVLPLLGATDVLVVGSFNAWEPIALSDDDGDGIWRVDIVLPPGRYEYAFLIDGHWWGHDPLADEYVRSFGEYSSVRYISGGAGG
jgi:1,4-alpha-glucan branching enzyme